MTMPSVITNLISDLEAVTETIATTDGLPFLRLLKSGEWVYGSDDVPVEEGSLWALSPTSVQTGFCAWGKGDLLGEVMAATGQPRVLKSDLPDVGEAWKEQIGCILQCISGEDTGTTVLFKASSHGGKKAFKAVLSAIVAQGRAGKEEVVPALDLQCDSYKHAEYGKIFFPILNVKKWYTIEELRKSGSDEPEAKKLVEEVVDVDDVDDVEEAPKRRRARS